MDHMSKQRADAFLDRLNRLSSVLELVCRAPAAMRRSIVRFFWNREPLNEGRP
jgi:hypothetical protein